MKGNRGAQAPEYVLYNELVAINQYFLHSKMFKDWGSLSSQSTNTESIDEMKRLQILVERTCFSRHPQPPGFGQPHYERRKEMLECDLHWNTSHTQISSRHRVGERKDFVSRDLAKIFSRPRRARGLAGNSATDRPRWRTELSPDCDENRRLIKTDGWG